MNPHPLDEVQRFIAEALRSLTRIDRDEPMCAGAENFLSGSDRLSPAEQLEIYRQQFWLRHTAAMLEDYPGVSGILGQHAWERLVESYLVDVRPTGYSLRDLGRGFAEHIERHPETPEHALCVDMARLEWAYTEIFDAAEPTALDPGALGALTDADWEHAIVVLLPALRVLSVRHPVAELRKRLWDAARSPTLTDPIPLPSPEPHELVVFRSPTRVLRYLRLEPLAAALLRELGAGTPLGSACERVAELHPDGANVVESSVQRWFADWTRRGFIIDVRPQRTVR